MGAEDLLRRARALVVSGWTQGADARRLDGTPTEPWSPEASAWSLLGALVGALEAAEEEAGAFPLTDLAAALDALAGHVDDDSLARWNDAPGRTLAQVESALAAAAGEAAGTLDYTPGLSDH